MLITILVPHKNSPQKLYRLLDSIPECVKVIVVDDDSGATVVNELNKKIYLNYPNVQLFENTYAEKNAGTARNVAIENCPPETQWVIFADADDEFETPALKRLIIQLNNIDNSDVVFFNCVAKREEDGGNGKRCDHYRALINAWPENRAIIPFSWPVPWGRAINFQKIIKAYGLKFSSRLAGNDIEFSAKLALTYPVTSIFPEDIYICYESSDSLTANLDAEKALSRLEANINRNMLYYEKGVDIVHYNYALRFFLKATPLIIKYKLFSIVVRELKSIAISLRKNLF
jgi:glycosyltransferase involved in cell wall biosynthesis